MTIPEIAALALKRVRLDLDLVVGVCGVEGMGKSNFSIALGQALDPNFSLERNMIYSPDAKEVQKRIISLPKYAPIILDEAIKVLLKDEHYSKMQIFLKKVFATARKQNKIIILCMPYFSDFSVYWRKNRIAIWFQIMDRGVGAAFVRDNVNVFSSDPWHLRKNEVLLEEFLSKRKLGDLGLSDKTYIYSRSVNFWRMFHFEKISDELEAQYKEIADRTVAELELKEEEDKAETWKARFALLSRAVIENNLMNQKQIADSLGLDPNVILHALKDVTGLTSSQIIMKTHRVFPKMQTVFSKFKEKGSPVAPVELPPEPEPVSPEPQEPPEQTVP